MKITKLGHCCLLIEEKGVRILTDPGMFTAEKHTAQTGLDVILITHEHQDHFHLQSLKILLKGNPSAKIICNPGVGALLLKEGIEHEVVGDGKAYEMKGVEIEGFGSSHAPIHSSLPIMENTGYFISNHFWYPGDAFTNPGKPVELLAFPVAGPWMKLSEAIDYVLQLKPKRCFPVHEMFVNPELLATGSLYKTISTVLEPQGIQFFPMDIDLEYEF